MPTSGSWSRAAMYLIGCACMVLAVQVANHGLVVPGRLAVMCGLAASCRAGLDGAGGGAAAHPRHVEAPRPPRGAKTIAGTNLMGGSGGFGRSEVGCVG